MGTKKSRLTPVVNIAEVREKDAARELAEIMQLRNQIRNQLGQLRDYRDEYKDTSIVGKNHTAETLADMQVFLSRLNKSIDGVRKQLLDVEEQLDQLRSTWQKSRAWTRSLEKAVARDVSRQENIQSRKDQKDQDEIASRTESRNSARIR